MAIASQPNTSPIAAYSGEAYFEFADSIVTTVGTWKQMVVVVVNSLTGQSVTVRKAPFSTQPFGLSTVATFRIDVSNIIQTYFVQTTFGLPFTTVGGFQFGQPNANVFYLDVTYEYVSASTGLIATTATNDITNSFTVLNTTFQNDALPFLSSYTAGSGRLFLTRSPRTQDICLSDNASLSFWIDGIDSVRVIENPKVGAPTLGVIDLAPTIATGTTGVITSGVVGLNAATYAFGGVTIDSNTAQYTVQLGTGIGGSFVAVSEVFTYRLVDCCPESDCRFYWLNSLGGVDSYTSSASLRLIDTPSSAQYEKPVPIPFAFFENGIAKFDSRKGTRTQAQTKFLCADEVQWLRELQASIRVYKQGFLFGALRLLPVVVTDVENVISDRRENGIVRNINFIDADPIEVQQYG